MILNLDLMNKYILDFKEYLFGSDKFSYVNFDTKCYPINYEFIFFNMEFYFPFFDKNNIPYSKKKKYNFSGISGFALANYNRYLKFGDLKIKRHFKQIKFIESKSNDTLSKFSKFL